MNVRNIAIVSGGSSGLGLEIARCLVKQAITTCVVGRATKKLEDAISLLSSSETSTQVLSFRANVGNEEEVKALFDHLTNQRFVIDKIFNVAGVGRFGDADKITGNMINTVFEANLIGLMLVSSYGLRAMKEAGGVIVNIMSTAALVGREKETVYCAAKWGARGFTEAIKVATKGTPVHVIAVYPGGMNTPFWSTECGLSPDKSKFMHPHDVASKIVEMAIKVDSSLVTDVTINRRG
jgi:short-subunit dehydrogenase